MKPFLRVHLGNPIELLFRILLGGVFVFSGTLKLIDPIGFQEAVRSYAIVGDPWPAYVALALPWMEVICGVCVLLRVCYPGALVLLGGSLAMFMMAVTSVWIRGVNIDCGCFGDKLPIDSYAVMLLIEASLLSIAVGLILGWRADADNAKDEPIPSAT